MQSNDIPRGLCQCGCGERTRLSTVTAKQYGAVKGQPRRFILGHGTRITTLRWAAQPDGCWMWLHALDAHGYSRISRNGRNYRAYVEIYEKSRGAVPAGLTLDHLCHSRDLACPGGKTCMHRRCVNPDHLEPVTIKVNVLRGRSPSAINAVKLTCTFNHPFDEQNTWIRKDKAGKTFRRCITCARERVANMWARRRGHPEPFSR